jgi:cob(I)alamin adenosyltransferase
MKIYTKTGDKGTTMLFGGKRVAKHELRIECYGTVDELNAHVGLIRDQKISSALKNDLIDIQDKLFTLGAILATEPGNTKVKLPELTEDDVYWLENKIDEMNETLPPMKHFILPGGNTTVSYTHIARCVCRRAERLVSKLIDEDATTDVLTLIYLNRLSDYLFVLSRKLAQELKAEEVFWIPQVKK